MQAPLDQLRTYNPKSAREDERPKAYGDAARLTEWWVGTVDVWSVTSVSCRTVTFTLLCPGRILKILLSKTCLGAFYWRLSEGYSDYGAEVYSF
ncbi:hypothetical protein Bca4012_020869 [Brassica carinata]